MLHGDGGQLLPLPQFLIQIQSDSDGGGRIEGSGVTDPGNYLNYYFQLKVMINPRRRRNVENYISRRLWLLFKCIPKNVGSRMMVVIVISFECHILRINHSSGAFAKVLQFSPSV